MITLSPETENLARRLAEAKHVTVEAAIRDALERQAANSGVPVDASKAGRRRMTIEEMLAVGKEIAAMPLLDPRSPRDIMDELNEI
jgi:antitoxin VapB